MGMQSGILYFDRRPTPPAPADGRVEPGLWMTDDHDDLWCGRASGAGRSHPPAGWAITWDGRIDNRDDLLLRLGSRVTAFPSDAAVALALVERWGVDGLAHLVGDWSLAIRDCRRRTLHLARDWMGARPLYYCVDPHFVAWSTSLGDLALRCGRAGRLTDAFAAGFMTIRPAPCVTPYEDIGAVPPGTCLSISADGAQQRRRFWRLEPGRIRYPRLADYEEHLRMLWREAVVSRMETRETIWAELSGGLDSSSVVCMADRALRSAWSPARAIRLVSHATLRSPEGDERRFIAEVERQAGVASEIVAVEDHQTCTDPEVAWVTPHALKGVGLACVRRVRGEGGRLVLSGRMGDAVMGCQPDNSVAVLDDLARGDVVRALLNLRLWSRATRKPFVELAWRLALPGWERPAETGIALLTPRLRILARSPAPAPPLQAFRRSKRELARMVLGYAHGARLDIPLLPPGIVYACPFTHRPLVEFMLAIPGEQVSAPGETRALMRRAFAGFVPPRILRRVSKGYYPPAAFRAAREMAASLAAPERLDCVERGWIDPEGLRAALRALTDGSGETGADIHSVLRLEAWLRARRDLPAIPRREEVNSHAVLNA